MLLKEVKKNTLFKSRTAHDHPGLWVMEKARSLLNDGVGVALAVAEGDLDGVEAGFEACRVDGLKRGLLARHEASLCVVELHEGGGYVGRELDAETVAHGVGEGSDRVVRFQFIDFLVLFVDIVAVSI